MKQTPTSIVLTLSGLIVASGALAASADVAENPFKVISARNAFDLKPPPPPPSDNPKTPEPPKSDLKLTGFSKIGGVKRVHIASANPKQAGAFTYYDIEEKFSQDGIEVLEIDMNNGSAKIRNGGIEATLTFEKNGIGPAKPSGPPITPGVPQPGNPNQLNPGKTAAQPNNGPIIVGAHNPTPAAPLPTFAQPNANPNTAGSAAGGSTAGNSGLRSIPSRNVRTAPANPPNNLSAEEQVIMMEAQRQRASQRGLELPPTPGIPSIPGGGN